MVKISIVKRAPSGGSPSRATSGLRAAPPQLTLGLRRSTQRTKTFAAAIASAPIFAQRPMMSGRSGTTELLVSPIQGRSRQQSLHTHFTITRFPMPWSLTLWPVVEPYSTFANQWVAVALRMTSSQPVRMFVSTTFAMAFPRKRLAATLFSATHRITQCWRGSTPPTVLPGAPLPKWVAFLHDLARNAFATLKPGGCLALLLAAQTEKDLPAGFGYLDHAFFGYIASLRAGFFPERRMIAP